MDTDDSYAMIGFDGKGVERVVVPTTGFVYPNDEGGHGDGDSDADDTIRRAMLETTVRLLQGLCSGAATAQEVGRRAIFTLYDLRPEQTHDELARQIGVSRQRVEQLLASHRSKNANVFNRN